MHLILKDYNTIKRTIDDIIINRKIPAITIETTTIKNTLHTSLRANRPQRIITQTTTRIILRTQRQHQTPLTQIQRRTTRPHITQSRSSR